MIDTFFFGRGVAWALWLSQSEAWWWARLWERKPVRHVVGPDDGS